MVEASEHYKTDEQRTAILTLAIALFGLGLWLVLAWLAFTESGGPYAIYILGLMGAALVYSSVSAVATLARSRAHSSKRARLCAVAVLVINTIYVAVTIVAVVGLNAELPWRPVIECLLGC